MQRLICIFAVLTAHMLLAADSKDEIQKELRSLQGTWRVTGLEMGGKPSPKESVMNFTFIVGADGKSTGKMEKSEYEAKISVDPKKEPKTIENAHETGASKGKKQFGIYKLDGDKWTVCMTAPGAKESDRPKTFDTKGTANVVFIFERVKEGK